MQVIRIPLVGESYVKANTPVNIDQVYDVAVGDEITTRTGEVCIVRELRECPYYGYEHYPCAYVVEENGAWSDYLVLDLYPEATVAAYQSNWFPMFWERKEPSFWQFEEVEAAGWLIRRSPVTGKALAS